MKIMIHIGRKVPKGFVELPGAMHLGRGIWMIRIEPAPEKPIRYGGLRLRKGEKYDL